MATFFIQLPSSVAGAAVSAVLAGIYFFLRKRSGASRIRALVASSLVLIAAMCAFAILGKRPSATPNRSAMPAQPSVATPARVSTQKPVLVSMRSFEAPRAVYGHSIVRGGIHSLGELLQVIATDPLAAQHYKGFDISNAHFIRLDHNIMAYVSYRVDGKGIYWTRKPELILAGEEVITDGNNIIRVRCGNMVSYSPQSPAESDAPTDTDTIVETFTPMSDTPLATAEFVPTSNTPTGGNTPPRDFSGGNGSGGSGSLAPPIFTGAPPSTVGNTLGPQPNTVSVGELPGHEEFYLLFAGIFVLFLIEKLRP